MQFTAIAALAALSVGDRLAGAPPKDETVRYTVVRLDTLGGTAGGGISINDPGWVTGFVDPGRQPAAHATLWRKGETIDLGTLGGPNSAVGWPVKNNDGDIVGIAETDEVDPLGETFSCVPFFGTPRDRPRLPGLPLARRRDDRARSAPGRHPQLRRRRQRPGPDRGMGGERGRTTRLCVAPQVLQFRAVIWKASDGGDAPAELPPSGRHCVVRDGDQRPGAGRRHLGHLRPRVRTVQRHHAVMWEDGVPGISATSAESRGTRRPPSTNTGTSPVSPTLPTAPPVDSTPTRSSGPGRAGSWTSRPWTTTPSASPSGSTPIARSSASRSAPAEAALSSGRTVPSLDLNSLVEDGLSVSDLRQRHQRPWRDRRPGLR